MGQGAKPKRTKWFFKEPKSTPCFASLAVAMGEADVHSVARQPDGTWHFLSAADVERDDDAVAMSSLGFIAETHPEIVPLYGLEPGWIATWVAGEDVWELVEVDDSWEEWGALKRS